MRSILELPSGNCYIYRKETGIKEQGMLKIYKPQRHKEH